MRPGNEEFSNVDINVHLGILVYTNVVHLQMYICRDAIYATAHTWDLCKGTSDVSGAPGPNRHSKTKKPTDLGHYFWQGPFNKQIKNKRNDLQRVLVFSKLMFGLN